MHGLRPLLCASTLRACRTPSGHCLCEVTHGRQVTLTLTFKWSASSSSTFPN